MKKVVLLISAMLLVAACAAPPTNREAAPANRAAEPAAAPLTESEATAKEKAVWDALKKKDYDGFANMLATDYLEVQSEAVYDKAGIVTYVKDLDLTDATFADWKFMPIGKDAALLMYNVTLAGKSKGKDVPPGPYRVGSVWVNRAGKWQGAFYQETTAAAAPPTAKAAATPTPATTSSPVAKPTEMPTLADPIARERAVWDTLKRKDYDAFASMLDAAQIEARPDGFHDKAASVAGVKGLDATKAELSDFKTIKLGTDGELVTYTVTIPGLKPEKERATTIWIKRGEKWLALYHQGTAVEAAAVSPSPVK